MKSLGKNRHVTRRLDDLEGGEINEVIVVYKFRSMYHNRPPEEGVPQATRDDPRVTRVGRLLRRTSLDELPQLFNVLRGNMSLVGPRPALPSEVIHFSDTLRTREQVLPGITGLWQVEARDNPSFDAYQRLDLFYVENWSLALDLVVMLGTAEQLLLRPVFNRRTGEMSAPAGVDEAVAA